MYAQDKIGSVICNLVILELCVNLSFSLISSTRRSEGIIGSIEFRQMDEACSVVSIKVGKKEKIILI